ncbi:hypothetical protein [Enterobacter hormaechei]|uniref:hypothetical protein n=1 Tax=Enterobacter hormaechei TaxID=158836 RepID=UPI000DCF6BC8|nr:hypothetical protein [Enterobacter hormaechei]
MTTNHVMRQLAFDAYLAVSQACLMGTADRDEKSSCSGGGQKKQLSQFQANANDELRCEKEVIEGMNKKTPGNSGDDNHKLHRYLFCLIIR